MAESFFFHLFVPFYKKKTKESIKSFYFTFIIVTFNIFCLVMFFVFVGLGGEYYGNDCPMLSHLLRGKVKKKKEMK